MSDLPSKFLTVDDIPINKPHFPNPHRYPYDLGSSSSTESESEDDDHLAGLTHRFSRSVSLQERLQIPYPMLKKMVFSSLPESTLNWNVSSPVTPLVHSDEDFWERIYFAADQTARMKMNMAIINANDDAFAAINLLGPPPLHHNHHHHHSNSSNCHRENEELIRQRHFLYRLNNGGGDRCGTARPVGFRQSARPPQVEHLLRQQQVNAFAIKSVLAASGCGSGTVAAKKEFPGTGVFLPRTGYSHWPPKSKKKPACSDGHLPARATMGPINPQPRQNMFSGFPAHHRNRSEVAEIVMARRHAGMLALQHRSTILVGVQERQIGGHPEIVLPQEWTY